jgi:hypothetical protein
MAKVVLYLALLLAPSLSAGEGIMSVGENQFGHSLISLDQSDENKDINFDDLDEGTSEGHTFLLKKIRALSFSKPSVLNPTVNHTKSQLIRAPPILLI